MINSSTKTPLLLAGAVLLSQSCSREPVTERPSSDTGSPALAIVAGSPISEADLLAEIERRHNRRQPVPAKEELLAAMVERAALIHRAKESGIADDPEVIRALGSVLVRELRQRELHSKLAEVEVTDQELRSAYEASAATFTKSAKNQLSILKLVAGEKASEEKLAEVRERMNEARRRHLANPSPPGRGIASKGFGALAVEFSDDQVTRYRGGDAGWLTAGVTGSRWPAEVLNTGHALEVGKVSEVIESTGDFFLVTKTDTRAASTSDFEAASATLRARLLAEKRAAVEQAFREQSERLAEVELIPDALARVQVPAAPPTAREPEPPALPAASQ